MSGRKLFYYEVYKAKEAYKTSQLKNKQIIVITARMEAEESVSNHLLKGFIDRLLNFEAGPRTAEAFLRQNFMFVILPMLNIDGVAIGNTSTTFSGQSPNSVFNAPDRYMNPESYYTKRLLKTLVASNKIDLFMEIRSSDIITSATMLGWKGTKSSEKPILEFPVLLTNWLNHFQVETSQ